MKPRSLVAWRQAAVEWVTSHPSEQFTTAQLHAELVSEGNPPPNPETVSTFMSQWAINKYPAQCPHGLRWVQTNTYVFERGKPNKARGIKRHAKQTDPTVLPPELLEYVGVSQGSGQFIYRDPDTHQLHSVLEF